MKTSTSRMKRRPLFGSPIAVLAVVVLGVTGLAPAGADPTPSATEAAVKPAHISTDLMDVPVSSAAFDQATASLNQAKSQLKSDQTTLDQATVQIAELSRRQDELTKRIATDTKIKAAADSQIVTLRTRLRHLALQAYVGIDNDSALDAALTLDTEKYLQARIATTLRRSSTESGQREYLHQFGISSAANKRLMLNHAALASTVEGLGAARSQVVASKAAIITDGQAIVARLSDVRDTRALAIVDDTDLPLVALDAYVHAALIARLRTPGCHLPWSLLAGIGKVESGQGTYGGAEVRQDGTLTKPIEGVPLDGTNGNESILKTDGDYLRAEGPMQFLPTTWAHVAVDGDDDGDLDIQNLYDAAATAGAYLCRNNVDVATEQGRKAAILTYNFSGEYVAKVTSAAEAYAKAVPNDLPA